MKNANCWQICGNVETAGWKNIDPEKQQSILDCLRIAIKKLLNPIRNKKKATTETTTETTKEDKRMDKQKKTEKKRKESGQQKEDNDRNHKRRRKNGQQKAADDKKCEKKITGNSRSQWKARQPRPQGGHLG
jgi:hypothetical protein